MQTPLRFALLILPLILAGCSTIPGNPHKQYSRFIAIADLSKFTRMERPNGEIEWTSPVIRSRADWNELVLSWNVNAPEGSFLRVEARAVYPSYATKYFSFGTWSPDDAAYPRTSVVNQKDSDGDVRADTLSLVAPARDVQIRLTTGGNTASEIIFKLLGISLCNSGITREPLPPNQSAWGQTLPVVERSQQSYPGGNGWCSPTSLSMVLTYWAQKEQCSAWRLDAPEVARGVSDHGFKFLTGNWTYNTAFAGSLKGIRAYVTRFSDIAELEEWIAAGFPVIISARWDLLQDGRPDDFNGHLTVCRGFTDDGDLIINDPWTDLSVESVQHVYKRANVARAWATSRNTVYLVYPEGAKVPKDEFGHWTD